MRRVTTPRAGIMTRRRDFMTDLSRRRCKTTYSSQCEGWIHTQSFAKYDGMSQRGQTSARQSKFERVGPLTRADQNSKNFLSSPSRCASIRDMDLPHFPMPQSVPAGMRLELSRAKLLPNSEKTISDWMEWLHHEYKQLQQGLGAEKAVFESTFLHNEEDGTRWIYHLGLIGDDSQGLDTSNPLGAKVQEFAMQSKESGWEELRPVFLIASPEIIESMQGWLDRQRQ